MQIHNRSEWQCPGMQTNITNLCVHFFSELQDENKRRKEEKVRRKMRRVKRGRCENRRGEWMRRKKRK
jgi:hypothetical protein